MAKLSLEGQATRTERIAVLTTPKIRKDLEKIATVNRKSLNSIINDAVQEYLDNHKDQVARFNAFFGEE